MENLNETKAIIYNSLLKEVFDIISQECRKEIEKILDERMEYYKMVAMSNALDIEEVRLKYGIYNDLKNFI
jgi:hypothetical protein